MPQACCFSKINLWWITTQIPWNVLTGRGEGAVLLTTGHAGEYLPVPNPSPWAGPWTPPERDHPLLPSSLLPCTVEFFRYFTCISNSVILLEIYSKDLCLWNYNIMLPICQWAGGKENNFLQFTVMRLEENDVSLSPLSLCVSGAL